jgi:rhodanese-related sulfurtransferase
MRSMPLFAMLIAALFLSGCFSVHSNAKFTYKKLTPEQYASYLRDSIDRYLIDVRTPGEYNKAHVSGAYNYNFLAFHFGRDVDSLDRNKTAFVYCQTCHRSPFAARTMKHKGFRCVYDLQGGFAKWAKAGHKTVSDSK